MASLTKDKLWEESDDNIKILTLEHHMAASRMGFLTLFEPLYNVNQFKTSLIDGTLSGLRFFTQIILPLISAKKAKNEFKVANVVKKHSPFFDKYTLKGAADQLEKLKEANESVNKLFSLWFDNQDPILLQILNNLNSSSLFFMPESLKKTYDLLEFSTEGDLKIEAWKNALQSPFSQIEKYSHYINDKSRFGTHQGIKGLEFPRVMVVLDDAETRGFLFSYEKLFNAKNKSASDLKNETEGKETSIDRTKRLFYVTCSRTQESLAIVAYSKQPEKIKEFAINNNWFVESEIEMLN